MKNENIIYIENMSHDGRGVARTAEGQALFVTGALPEETVAYQIQGARQRRRRYLEAKTVQVITPSSKRVPAPCPHFEQCGGCVLQHYAPSSQVETKQKTVLEQLQHFGKVIPETVLPPLTGPDWGYRYKARLGVRYVEKKGKVLIGFRERDHRGIADLQACHVLHPSISRLLPALGELVRSLTVYRDIPQIEVAVGEDAAALIFRHLKPLSESDHSRLCDFAVQQDIHLYLQPKGIETVHRLWPIEGACRLTYELPEYGLKMHHHPCDFTQVNPLMNRKLIVQALSLLDLKKTDRVLDLFCGIGNFTLPLATAVQSVVGVEGAPQAVQRAKENMTYNEIQNAEFQIFDLTQDPTRENWAGRPYNKVLLDPSRAGAEFILPFIAGLGVEKIMYVSCNPATLARDCGLLVHRHGYQLKTVGVVDMFPHTMHIETVALLEKA